MRSHCSTYIKPPPNPSKRGKNGGKRRRRNQTADQTTIGKMVNQPAHPRMTGKRSSKTTMKHWWEFPRLRSTSIKQIRHSAGAVDVTAIIRWNSLQRRYLTELN
jgi:hypothetical protein